jgi:hypothetical protein
MSFTTQFLPQLPRTVSTNHFSAAGPKFGIMNEAEEAAFYRDNAGFAAPKEASPAVANKLPAKPDVFTPSRPTPSPLPPTGSTPSRRVLGVRPTSVKSLVRRALTSGLVRPRA